MSTYILSYIGRDGNRIKGELSESYQGWAMVSTRQSYSENEGLASFCITSYDHTLSEQMNLFGAPVLEFISYRLDAYIANG